MKLLVSLFFTISICLATPNVSTMNDDSNWTSIEAHQVEREGVCSSNPSTHWHYRASAGVRCHLQPDVIIVNNGIRMYCGKAKNGLPGADLKDQIITSATPNRCSCKESFTEFCQRALGLITNGRDNLINSMIGPCYKCGEPWCTNWDAFKVPGECKSKDHCGQTDKCRINPTPVSTPVAVNPPIIAY